MLFSPATAQEQVRLYLDESGTLGFGDEVFTMAMVRVHDLPKLEACIARNKTTQAEIKASQMKTGQKLDLARKLLEQNSLQIYLLTIDPAAAYACERKLDKELLYDSMIAQAMAYYLGRNELPQGRSYRLSLDMRGGIRESFEDMVRESIGNVLMRRDDPLVTALDIRYMDSKYSAGVQVADLFSNIYRTALSQKDSPCNGFLNKCRVDGIVHVGFAFGLPELADQMAQIAAALRARVEYDAANNVASTFRTLPIGAEVTAGELAGIDEGATTESGTPVATAAKEQAGATGTADMDARPAAQEAAPLQDARQTPASGKPATDENAGDAGGARADDADVRKPNADGAAAVAETGTGTDAGEETTEMPRALSRSARRRRSRAARKAADAAQEDAGVTDASTQEHGQAAGDQPAATASKAASDQAEPHADSTESHTADQAEGVEPQAQASPKTRRRGRKPKAQTAAAQAPEAHAETDAPTEPAPAPEAVDASPVASGEAYAAEPVVLTARERRQKAAKKTARGAAKRASKDAMEQGGEAATEGESAQADTPQAPDAQPASAAPEVAPDAAIQPEKPRRTRTRTRSKTATAAATAQEAGVGAQTGTSTSSEPEQASPAPDGMPADEPAPAKPKPRRTRTRKTAAKPAEGTSTAPATE